MRKANYQIMNTSGWLITFEIARDAYVRATRGQRSSHLPHQQNLKYHAMCFQWEN